ncbi:hypothetical protein NFI96_005181, partial [Prochilodus magdalenae]
MGCPAIWCDRGPQFTSRYWKAFCELMGASVSLSSGFHPQSNGQTERVNQDLGQTLRCLVADSPSSWARHLPWAEYAHNTLWHSSLGMSPFECQFGYPPPIFPEQERTVGVATAEQYVRRCRQAWRKARAALVAASGAHKRAADRRRQGAPTYRRGQRVWLSAKDLPLRATSRKLGPRYVGPFKVDRRVNPVAYQLLLPPSMRIHPVFHVSRLKLFLCGRVAAPSRPPAPRLIQDHIKPTVRVEPQSSVYTGDTVTLTCELPPPPDWMIYWRKDSEYINPPQYTYSLIVSDPGEYQCGASRGDVYTEYSDPVRITVGEGVWNCVWCDAAEDKHYVLHYPALV